ncbi:hypothetical protein [Streptomyces sp. NPDC007984]|uniref:hypothetical protein n=1 Tax=Streptomyces sp. NPDC007984 TaxID=3364801 RepID=UPI0036EB5DAD
MPDLYVADGFNNRVVRVAVTSWVLSRRLDAARPLSRSTRYCCSPARCICWPLGWLANGHVV